MKKSIKKLFATLLATLMLALSAPAVNLLNVGSVFSTKASAYDSVENSYDYLWNLICTLGYADDKGDYWVDYSISNTEYVSFVADVENNRIHLIYDDSDYEDLYSYNYRCVEMILCPEDDIYATYVYCDDDDEDYVQGIGNVFATEYTNDSIYDFEILDESYYFVENTYDAQAALNRTLRLGMDGIHNALVSYADCSLGNFGFNTYIPIEVKSVELNGLFRDSFGWKYYRYNEIDFDYVGLARNNYGWWLVRDGGIDFGFSGFFEDEFGYHYIKNGKKDFYVGLVKDPADGLWWYVSDGCIDFNYTGLAKNQYGWWYVNNGTIDFTYTGMAKNQYGWWYAENGKLNSKYNGMAKNQYGWWYFSNGKIDYKFNGLAKNQYGWWYIKNGTIDYKFQGLAKNQYGWWYVQNGTINFKYNGYASNQYGTWKVVNGKVVGK